MADIQIRGRDGTFTAYRATPPSGSGPGIVVIQEIFGVNKWVRSVADELAAHGFVVYAPDLFWRQEPGIQITDREMDRAFQLYQAFDEAKGVEDIEETIAELRQDPACSGKVGVVGFCLGGKLAYLTATRTDADCAVGYYGVGIEKALDEAGAIKRPLMLHIAKDDGFVPHEAQAQVHAALDSNPNVTIYDYPGLDHAFARVGGEHYSREGAARANKRTLEFFRNHLIEAEEREEETPAPRERPRPATRRARPAPRAPARSASAAPKRASAKKKPSAAKKPAPRKPQAKRAGKSSARSAGRRSSGARRPSGRGRR
jgi:carboxymethylenebutenolidase